MNVAQTTHQKKLRTTLLFFVFLFVYCAIIANLFYVQIFQRSFFTSLGTQQYAVTVSVQPPRATIYDCNGKPIAVNAECLSAFVLPHEVKTPENLKSFLQQ